MFLGQVVRFSGKTTFTERYLSFPTPMDKIVTSAIFGKSSLPPVNDANKGYANTNFYFGKDSNSFKFVRNEKGDVKGIKAITTVKSLFSVIKEEMGAVALTVQDVRYAISSRFFFYKTEGDSISDASFAHIKWDDESLRWFKARDILGQSFLFALRQRASSVEIVHAFFPITVGEKKWAVESVVGVATEGVTIAATQYVNCKFNIATYDEDCLRMDRLNDLARENVIDAPYILCFGEKFQDQERIPEKLTKAGDFSQDFWARRKSIYRRWKKVHSAQNEPFVSDTVCVGRTIEGERQISFSKSPLLLQLDCIGSVWLDSLIGYVFSSGKSYLAKALNSDVVQAAIQTTYSYLCAWYPPFKQNEDDPVRALGSWENICSGFLDLKMEAQKLTGDIWATHRLIRNRSLLFPLLVFERNEKNNKFGTFFVTYDPGSEDYRSYYLVGTYEGKPYEGKRSDTFEVVTFNQFLSGDRMIVQISDSNASPLKVEKLSPVFPKSDDVVKDNNEGAVSFDFN